MKLILILSLTIMLTAAPDPQLSTHYNVQLLKNENKNDGLGNYKYSFNLSDGTQKVEQGEIANPGQKDEHIKVTGSYSWIAPDGKTYKIFYTADVNGFKPILTSGYYVSVKRVSYIPPQVIASLLK